MVTARERGFSLMEMIVAIGILAVLGGSLIPLFGRQLDTAKVERVKAKLERIRAALEEYHYEKKEFPASLTDAAFLEFYLHPGVMRANATSFYPALHDDLYDLDGLNTAGAAAGTDFQFFLDQTSNPERIWVWSCGPNRNDESTRSGSYTMGGDDIYIRACEEIPGRRRTELMMNIISFAYARKMMTAGARPAMAAWGVRNATDADGARVKIDLGIEFAYDGFAVTFLHGRTSAVLQGCVVSNGPDQTVNTGKSNSSIGTGDDIRQ